MLKSLSLLSVALLLSSCNGNGWNYPAGTACDAGAFAANTPSPSATNLPANSRKVTVPNQRDDSPTHANLPDMPEGTYTFATADIFYSTKPDPKSAETPMLVQLHDELAIENNPKAAMTMQCVRETTVQHFEPQSLKFELPTAFEVDSDKVTFTKRTFVFNILFNQLAPAPTIVDPAKYSDLSQIFTGDQKPLNWVIVNNPGGGNPADYELRAEYACAEDKLACSYTISIHMNYFAPGTDIPSNQLPNVQQPPAQKPTPAPAPVKPFNQPRKK